MTQQLFDMADALGCTIKYEDLSHLDRDGDYDLKTNTIRLQENMSYRLLRWTLAHELAHVVFGDSKSKFGPVHAKQERRADEWAALRLITHAGYREAEAMFNGNKLLMAQHLDVVEEAIDVYQRILLRVGETVYVAPRLGAGQWAHKATV
ncbi:ImmA/IrrE family metallo-endopeptidase [Microbacterium sp. NPDC089698]|uniref:ImmA/IrrE family metallo-endopeptidase n=1 Tax=Microbacterium sp. NPDC089698 TaxID=3364200 RepID=UPI0037F74D49